VTRRTDSLVTLRVDRDPYRTIAEERAEVIHDPRQRLAREIDNDWRATEPIHCVLFSTL